MNSLLSLTKGHLLRSPKFFYSEFLLLCVDEGGFLPDSSVCLLIHSFQILGSYFGFDVSREVFLVFGWVAFGERSHIVSNMSTKNDVSKLLGVRLLLLFVVAKKTSFRCGEC